MPDSEFDQTIISSFPSIKKTLLHIWDAQVIWYKRLNGDSLDYFPSRDFKGGKDQALNLLESQSKEFADFVHQNKADWFQQDILFSDTRGNSYTTKAWEILHHCMNHSTYHRGQLITMFRQLEHSSAPRTDYIWYLRSKL